MKKIDAAVRSALNKLANDDQTVRVLIACNENESQRLALELVANSAEVHQVIPEMDMLVVSVTSTHLSLLEKSDEICSVELDEDVSTLDS